jgi:N-formylmethionyl-tRNA deformylase
MAVLPLVIAPDPRLNRSSEQVEAVTPDIKKLAADMLDTMYANNGIGLAAVQVGVHKRIIVVDVDWPSPR